ncbi:MAG TPA: DUF3047 domain-containing protein [Nitrospiria bacterium]|jgi:hypothetical protein
MRIFSFFFMTIGLIFIHPAVSNAQKNPGILVWGHFTQDQQENGIPLGWSVKRWTGGYDIFVLRDPDGNDVLRLKSEKNSFGLYKKAPIDLKQYPILTWRWKVTQLPEGGDVRSKKTDDQAAQVYVVFPRFPAAINSRMVGYIWENLTPKGLEVPSQKSSNTRYIVLQSGPDLLGTWQTERRNVYDDYIKLFGEEPTDAGGVTLMIDSDDTKTSAESFFDQIQFEKP